MGVGQVDLAVDADQAERALLLSLDTREVTHESLPFPFEIRRCIRTTVPSGRPRGDEHDEQGGRCSPPLLEPPGRPPQQRDHEEHELQIGSNRRQGHQGDQDEEHRSLDMPQRALLGRCRGSTKLRTNGVTTRTPMASPAHHTAHEPGSSWTGRAPDATRVPVPTEALMLMLSRAPTKTMAVASRRRSICRWKPIL